MKKLILFLLIFVMFSVSVSAYDIKGVVISDAYFEEGVPGVYILAKDTTTGERVDWALTNNDGEFILEVDDYKQYILEFSYPFHKQKRIENVFPADNYIIYELESILVKLPEVIVKAPDDPVSKIKVNIKDETFITYYGTCHDCLIDDNDILKGWRDVLELEDKNTVYIDTTESEAKTDTFETTVYIIPERVLEQQELFIDGLLSFPDDPFTEEIEQPDSDLLNFLEKKLDYFLVNNDLDFYGIQEITEFDMTFGAVDYTFYGNKWERFYIVLKIEDEEARLDYSIVKVILMKDFVDLCGNNRCDDNEDIWNCPEDCTLDEPVVIVRDPRDRGGRTTREYNSNQANLWNNNAFEDEVLDDCSKSCCQTLSGSLIKNSNIRNHCYGIIGGRSDLCSADKKGVYEAYCTTDGCIRESTVTLCGAGKSCRGGECVEKESLKLCSRSILGRVAKAVSDFILVGTAAADCLRVNDDVRFSLEDDDNVLQYLVDLYGADVVRAKLTTFEEYDEERDIMLGVGNFLREKSLKNRVFNLPKLTRKNDLWETPGRDRMVGLLEFYSELGRDTSTVLSLFTNTIFSELEKEFLPIKALKEREISDLQQQNVETSIELSKFYIKVGRGDLAKRHQKKIIKYMQNSIEAINAQKLINARDSLALLQTVLEYNDMGRMQWQNRIGQKGLYSEEARERLEDFFSAIKRGNYGTYRNDPNALQVVGDAIDTLHPAYFAMYMKELTTGESMIDFPSYKYLTLRQGVSLVADIIRAGVADDIPEAIELIKTNGERRVFDMDSGVMKIENLFEGSDISIPDDIVFTKPGDYPEAVSYSRAIITALESDPMIQIISKRQFELRFEKNLDLAKLIRARDELKIARKYKTKENYLAASALAEQAMGSLDYNEAKQARNLYASIVGEGSGSWFRDLFSFSDEFWGYSLDSGLLNMVNPARLVIYGTLAKGGQILFSKFVWGRRILRVVSKGRRFITGKSLFGKVVLEAGWEVGEEVVGWVHPSLEWLAMILDGDLGPEDYAKIMGLTKRIYLKDPSELYVKNREISPIYRVDDEQFLDIYAGTNYKIDEIYDGNGIKISNPDGKTVRVVKQDYELNSDIIEIDPLKFDIKSLDARVSGDVEITVEDIKNTKEYVEIQKALNTIYFKYRNHLEDYLFDGQKLLENLDNDIGENIDAHGVKLAPGIIHLDDLIVLLAEGIDETRDFYTAPLGINMEAAAGVGAGLGTSGGTAYKDGLFIVTSNPYESIGEHGIKNVLINPGYGEPELMEQAKIIQEELTKLFPDKKILLYTEAEQYFTNIIQK